MKPTWRDILDRKGYPGHIDVMFERAINAGYEYFCWNDHIYKIGIGGQRYADDTGWTAQDIE